MRRVLLLLAVAGCARPVDRVPGVPAAALKAEAIGAQDTTPKAELRMVPPEAYMRTYLELFGGLVPQEAQKKARGGDGANLFDTWNDYVSALGFPDYALDIPRQTQTNALMLATIERLGIALCDRAVEHDLPKGNRTVPDRTIFAFDPKPGPGVADFAPRFDVLHRTFLGYPAALAPPERTPRFFALYTEIARVHAKESPRSRFTPDQAAWAAVCYGLVRHPEFHLY